MALHGLGQCGNLGRAVRQHHGLVEVMFGEGIAQGMDGRAQDLQQLQALGGVNLQPVQLLHGLKNQT